MFYIIIIIITATVQPWCAAAACAVCLYYTNQLVGSAVWRGATETRTSDV